MPSNVWLQFLMSQLWSVPYGLVCLLGLVTSIIYLTRHPTPAILALIAFVMILTSVMGGVGLQFWLICLGGNEASSEMMSRVFGISAFVRSALSAGALCLLTVAVFVGRQPKSPFAMQK